MMRKLISWLSFTMAFFLILLSCVHDEIYTPSEQERQEIVSKSLWKEDTLFIHRIYDHFGKSFMPSAEKKEAFISEYGTPAWEYAMTMGFGKNQLYVPVIKNGRVHGMIRVLRHYRQASYSFTQDREALDFFETVIYNPRNCHLKPQKDEKTGMANSAKAGGYTWKCTKRVVTTGWHMEGETMVLETTVVESCKYTYTGMKPAVDHLEVATDGMESGGGDDEEYEVDPCDKTKSILNKPHVQQGINNVKAQALQSLSNINAGETGFKEKKDGTIAPADVNSNHNVVFNDVTDSYGGYHNHTALGTHMFAPRDIAETLFGFAAAQTNVADAYFGMIAAEWCSSCPNNVQYIHYVIQYTGTSAELGNYIYSPAQMNQFIMDYRKKVNKLLKDPMNSNNNGATLNNIGLERLFFDTLKNIGIDGKVNLQRVESNGTVNNITEINSTINATPCP